MSSTQGILRMLHPPIRWGLGTTIVLKAFMDGSGTHAASRVVAIGGFIAEESTWLDFDSRWNAVLDDGQWPTRLSEFHMVDCVRGNGEFLEGGWVYAQRLALYGDLCRVIVNSKIRPIASSVISECFDQILPSDLALLREPRTRLGTPLDVAFHMLAQQILAATFFSGPSETVAILFDKDNRDREDNFSDFCEQYGRDYFLADTFSGYGFADSRQFSPLQAADLLAYGTLHLAQRQHYPSEAEPHFPVIPAFWNMLTRLAQEECTSPYGTMFNLDSLQQLIEKVKTGDMLPKKQRSR